MMWDPASVGLTAVGRQSPYAFPLLFVAGALTSIGPCSAPRVLAAAGLASAPRTNRLLKICAFICGILVVYVAFALFGAVLADALRFSSWIYGLTGIALVIGGLAGLLRLRRGDFCASKRTAIPSGAALFLGASTALIVSPCCTPMLASIVAFGAATGSAIFAALCVISFGLGHAAPVMVVGSFGSIVTVFEKAGELQDALSTIAGALMMGLGAYYLVLV